MTSYLGRQDAIDCLLSLHNAHAHFSQDVETGGRSWLDFRMAKNENKAVDMAKMMN